MTRDYSKYLKSRKNNSRYGNLVFRLCRMMMNRRLKAERFIELLEQARHKYGIGMPLFEKKGGK